ncbi:MAG: tRNA epoxyqueuosine(34) reductase QueG [Parvularculaceae bacterium]|nr:tRNA epoxyqueuosine(34) reductase QueG [Parvularculaceae bacterium]
MTAPPLIAERIKKQAIGLGFDDARIARADAIPDAPARLRAFLDAGRHGDMAWMETRAGERGDPRTLWAAARSIVMLGLNYGPDGDPLAILEQRDRGAVSVYARGRDYHDVVKKKLKALGRFIAETFACEVKVFVDTAPVMEKPLAEAAGVGWQGKHTNLVSRRHGSWLFLGAVFTTLDLEADEKGADHCGQCRRCLDICPTDAFPAPYELDARRCISYLTIEHKGPIPKEFRAAIGNRIYGCDDCLAVCPWNKFASASREAQLRERADLAAPPLDALSALGDGAFRERFSGSPIKRIGRDRFVRNVLIAIGNSGEAGLSRHARALLDDPSPLVRGAAVWALSRLLAADDFAALKRKHAGAEADPGVLAEWREAGL